MATIAEKIASLDEIINDKETPANIRESAEANKKKLEAELAEKKEEKKEETSAPAEKKEKKTRKSHKKAKKVKKEKKEKPAKKAKHKSHKVSKKAKKAKRFKKGSAYQKAKAKKAAKHPAPAKKAANKSHKVSKKAKKAVATKVAAAVKTAVAKEGKTIYHEIDEIVKRVEGLKPEMEKMEVSAQKAAAEKIHKALSSVKFAEGGEVKSHKPTLMEILFGKKEFKTGGAVGESGHHPHLHIDKGFTAPHGYSTERGEKGKEYSEGKHMSTDKGYRTHGGLETKKSSDNKKQYTGGGEIEAWSAGDKKMVVMHKPVIHKKGNRYTAKGMSEGGKKLAKFMGHDTAMALIDGGHAEKGW